MSEFANWNPEEKSQVRKKQGTESDCLEWVEKKKKVKPARCQRWRKVMMTCCSNNGLSRYEDDIPTLGMVLQRMKETVSLGP